MRRPDATSLVAGILFVLLAALADWVAFGGRVSGGFLTVAAPLVLVVLGVVGLLLSRSST